MFDIGGGELMLILIVVVVLFGPKKLPELMQGLGKGIREFKKAQRDFTEHINTAFEEEQRRDYRRKNSGDDRSPGNTIPRNSQSGGSQTSDSSGADSSAPDSDERHDQLAGGGMDEQLAAEAQSGEENPSEAPRADIPFPTAPPTGAVPRGNTGVKAPPTDLPPSHPETEKGEGGEDNHTHDI